MSSASDEQLRIERAQAGDRQALEQLLVEYEPQLAKHICSRLPASLQGIYSPEDVTQQALTRAFLKIDRLRATSPQAFAVWLKAIGERTLMELIKAQRRQKRGGNFTQVPNTQTNGNGSAVDLLGQLPADSATASQLAARQEALMALELRLADIPMDQRQAIELHILQRKSLAETATMMGRSQGAVRGLIQRGKQQLGEAMGRASAWLSSW